VVDVTSGFVVVVSAEAETEVAKRVPAAIRVRVSFLNVFFIIIELLLVVIISE